MKTYRHFVPEVETEIAVCVNSGALDPYRATFASGFPVPETLRYLAGQGRSRRLVDRLQGRSSAPLFVDVGANIGGVAFFAAALGMDVLAVEALPENYLLLCRGVLANGFKRVVPCHVAASSVPGLLGFAGEGAWGHVPKATGEAAAFPVPALRGDEILALYGFEEPDVVKIDVEGHELPVIEGLEKTLRGARPVVIIESNTWTCPVFGDYEKPLDRIRKHGYAVFGYVGHEVKDDEDSFVQEACVADYFCVPREKLGKVPMPSRRSLSFEERVALVSAELLGPVAHWRHAAHVIDRLEQRNGTSPGLEALKVRIAGNAEAVDVTRRHPGPTPRWLP